MPYGWRRHRDAPHTHPCAVCKAPVKCYGTYEENHDGFPEVICGSYHLPGGDVADVRCPVHEEDQ